MSAPPRRIAHLDMDAFYASVELLTYPELKGQPMVVGGPRADGTRLGTPDHPFPRLRDYKGRGVVTTCTYAARAMGVRSGMGLMKAAALAPDALLLPGDFEAYRRISRAFKAALREIAPLLEDRGIDEVFLDLTEVPGDSEPLGRRLKAAVHGATGLTCSLGITPNKLLAKVASELQKPDGLTILAMADVPTRLWPLPVGALNGIGPKASERLRGLGLITLGDLAAADPALLAAHFGETTGRWLWEAAHGRSDSPVVTHQDPKSISRETTFERDLHPRGDREQLSRILLTLCQKLAEDLARKGWRARTVGLKLRFDDFSTLTRDLTLEAAVDSADALRDAARQCLRRVALDRKLRLLGIRAGHLVRADEPGPARQAAEMVPLFPEDLGEGE